jgi:hypothetical protein
MDMASPLRDPKELADWFELDYFRRPREMRRWKLPAAAAVLTACAVALAATALHRDAPRLVQSGPVSRAHAMFNDNCRACHTEAFSEARNLWPGQASSISDAACRSCHDGPAHNKQAKDEAACAACHREHRGRELLAIVDDGHCTRCHASDLQRKDGQPSDIGRVDSFVRGHHPEFALLRQGSADPGTIRFNHEVHLQSSLRGVDGRPTQLDCSACHQPDASRRSFLPIDYRSHCASCHPLSLQADNAWPKAVAERFRSEPAPHVAPSAVRAQLQERLLRLIREQPKLLTEAPPQPRPLPGWLRPVDQTPDEARWTQSHLAAIEFTLFSGAGGCRYCHEMKPGSGGLPEVAPSMIRRVWFEHARFDHDSHRLLACTECHAARTSQVSSDVLMPKIASCQQCHNPHVGTRSSCGTCHNYHDRSHESYRGEMTIKDLVRDE